MDRNEKFDAVLASYEAVVAQRRVQAWGPELQAVYDSYQAVIADAVSYYKNEERYCDQNVWFGHDNTGIVMYSDDERAWWTAPQYAPNQTWVHVVNGRFDNIEEFVNKFVQIEGEVCFSDGSESDWLATRYGQTKIAIMMDGVPSGGVWDRDIWSDIDDAGNRCIYGQIGGNRAEAWAAPSKMNLSGIWVQTDNEKVITELKSFCESRGIVLIQAEMLVTKRQLGILRRMEEAEEAFYCMCEEIELSY